MAYEKNVQMEDLYGENCFSEEVMKQYLPKSIFNSFKAVQRGEEKLTSDVAEVIANAMKDWALQKGATHYTHWFQPLTGYTAEKHDSFISPLPDGTILMQFSGKELIQGEPDASSFPSGGLRTTFEARGYTAWDTTSPAFIKVDAGGETLCIPTAFVSYTGEALDKKVPLLRSMDALNQQGLRVLRALGDTETQRITPFSGPEQEYFLIDRDFWLQRPDLRLTGRTIFGSMSAKGQEMDDHYFGAIQERVAAYMTELNNELWKLGISAKTQHNEVAPHQYELAVIYSTASIATDWNQLVMETMDKVAEHHNLVCLLHEKPFRGVNGSGKHNNWNLGTDTGINLLKPGKNTHQDARFLLFLTSVIKAVDLYAPLLRATAAGAGNDHRLGENEAPPTIISIFLGDEIYRILEDIAAGKKDQSGGGKTMNFGVDALMDLPMDATDRNRTSPFAFTGNRFEFRMGGSSQSAADSNVVLNTIMAEVLGQAADRLEKSSDPWEGAARIIAEDFKAHRRVIFDGNGYSEEWAQEAAKRGLSRIDNTVDALLETGKDYSVELFGKHKVLGASEVDSRIIIALETYSKKINIEASLMVEMAERGIYPAAADYITRISSSLAAQAAHLPEAPLTAQKALLRDINSQVEGLLAASSRLEEKIKKAQALENMTSQARAFQDTVVPAMQVLRNYGDALEKLTAKDLWPFPSYEDLLFLL